MNVLVWEFLTGGALLDPSAPLADSLRIEGRAMVLALLEDLLAIERLTIHWIDDGRNDLPAALDQAKSLKRHLVSEPADVEHALPRHRAHCDAVFLIAPETGGTLLRWTRQAEELGYRLVSAGSQLVSIASDKWRTNRRLAAAGVPVPPAVLARAPCRADALPSLLPPGDACRGWVAKPADGAGSQGIRRVPSVGEAATATVPIRSGDLIECFVPGIPAAVLAVSDRENGTSTLLPATRQRIDPDSLAYLGGVAPLEDESLRARAEQLARQALDALPRSQGLIGIDLILGDALDGSRDAVIEVNPRMTTSYVGLRAVCRDNLARWLVPEEARRFPPSWQDAPVAFDPSGQVRPLQ